MNTNKNDKDNFRVLVIGAGAAGLAAGRRLKEAGYEAILLEARDRVGGRAFTNYDMAPHPVEAGAEWINGYDVVTWSLLREFGLYAQDEQNWKQFGPSRCRCAWRSRTQACESMRGCRGPVGRSR